MAKLKGSMGQTNNEEIRSDWFVELRKWRLRIKYYNVKRFLAYFKQSYGSGLIFTAPDPTSQVKKDPGPLYFLERIRIHIPHPEGESRIPDDFQDENVAILISWRSLIIICSNKQLWEYFLDTLPWIRNHGNLKTGSDQIRIQPKSTDPTCRAYNISQHTQSLFAFLTSDSENL